MTCLFEAEFTSIHRYLTFKTIKLKALDPTKFPIMGKGFKSTNFLKMRYSLYQFIEKLMSTLTLKTDGWTRPLKSSC